MGFGPDEAGIDDADLGQAAELAQAVCEEFLRFEGSTNPAGRGLKPPLAVLAAVKNCLSLNALRNIDRQLHTVLAKSACCCCSIDRRATVATKDTKQQVR